jgi:hypothetical protein
MNSVDVLFLCGVIVFCSTVLLRCNLATNCTSIIYIRSQPHTHACNSYTVNAEGNRGVMMMVVTNRLVHLSRYGFVYV